MRLYKMCEVCDKPFYSVSFGQHMLVKHGKRGPFFKTCDLCQKQYSTNSLPMHMERQHHYGKFLCAKCGLRCHSLRTSAKF